MLFLICSVSTTNNIFKDIIDLNFEGELLQIIKTLFLTIRY